jgi:hypothetical protein
MNADKSDEHVTWNADGYLVRCGGKSLCKICRGELAQAAPTEVAQGEAVEVVGYQWLDTAHYRKHLPNFAQNQPNQDEFRPLMTVAQHNRIVSAQRIKMCIALKERNDARAALTAPQPDAELVELLSMISSRGLSPVLTEDELARIDAKLASL